MKKARLISIILFAIATVFFASNINAQNETAGLLAQTLRYLATDYKNAVDNNKTVLSEAEYTEMTDFAASVDKNYQLLKNTFPKATADSVQTNINLLNQLIIKKAPPKNVFDIAIATQQIIIREAKLTIAPKNFPNRINGKAVYLANCNKCHGENGRGDGELSKGLIPPPSNLTNSENMQALSPYDVYNTVRLGIAGTGMAPLSHLSEDEVWDVAFYVKSLAYKNPTDKAALSENDLTNIASKNDIALSTIYPEKSIAAIRYFEPSAIEKFNTLQSAKKYLRLVEETLAKDDYHRAYQLATMAYLEGIEPVEGGLRNSHPALLTSVEKQFSTIRKKINDNRPATEINAEIAKAYILIDEVDNTISNKSNTSFWMDFFMSVSILLREAMEAFLILLILFSIVRKSGNVRMRIYVNLGWISAILIGIILYAAGQEIIFKNVSRFEILEGIMTIIAIGVLLYLGFWMHSKEAIKKWTDYVKESVVKANETGNNLLFGSLSFIVVFREVAECVLFLSALNLQSAGQNSNAIALGFIVTMIFVLTAGFFVIRFSARLPLNTLFQFSAIMMMALAVILTGKAVRAFQEVGYISETPIPFVKIDILGIFPYAENIIAQVLMIILLIALRRFLAKK